MAFLPSTRKYIEDYTNDDWKSYTYSTSVTPTAVRGTFTGGTSIVDMIPNYFHQEWYITSTDTYLYNSPLMNEMFSPSNPPAFSPSNIPRCYVIAGIKKAKKQDITLFLMIPAANSAKYYTGNGGVMSFHTPANEATPTSTTLGPLWTGRVHLNSDSNAWILQNGTSYSTVRNNTKYKTITYSDGCIYDIYEITSYSRDSAPSTNYRVLYQYPVNSTRKWNESAFTKSHNGGTYYDAQSYIKVAYACRSASTGGWGNGASLGTLPSAPHNIDDRKMGIRFWKTDYSISGGGSYLTPNTNTIYDIEKSYQLVSYISEYNLPNAITTTAKCGNSTEQSSMYGNSTLATGAGEKYGSYKWGIYTSWERYILPGNALMGPLTFTVTYNVTLPTWNKHTNKSGTVVYDDDNYTVVNNYTYNFKVDMTNVPTFTIATGTRYRNHNAKYAVLANDFDYFDYNWKAQALYAVDPTVKLTLSYGDQVVVTKSGDSSSNAAQSFQHGPFLVAPTTQGQLVQITGIVTDARGRASAEKVFDITDNNSGDALEYLRFYNYNYPTVMVQGYRCLQNGTPDPDNGTYVKLTATYTFSPVDYGLTTYSEGTTDGKLKIKLRPHSGTLSQSDYNYTITTANGNKEIMLAVGLDQSVDIDVQVTDFIGNVFDASTEFVPSSRVVFDFRAGGSALSIGKRNEFDNALEVAWDTTFYGNVTIRGNVNITGQKQTATTADAVTYYDSKNIGARTVQAALDTLASKAGVSTSQVQAIVNQAIANLDVPDDTHINQLITTKINNIVFPPSISETRALELIADALADFNPGIDETTISGLIEEKLTNYAKKDELSSLATRSELTTGYYNKQEVDKKVAEVTVDKKVIKDLIDAAVADMPTNETAVNTANEALQKAEEAETASGTAVIRSNTALEKADEAKAIAEDAKKKIDDVVAGVAPAAEDVSFNDTISLEATNVQLAIVKTNEKILTSAQIQTMIDEKFNSIINGNNVRY